MKKGVNEREWASRARLSKRFHWDGLFLVNLSGGCHLLLEFTVGNHQKLLKIIPQNNIRKWIIRCSTDPFDAHCTTNCHFECDSYHCCLWTDNIIFCSVICFDYQFKISFRISFYHLEYLENDIDEMKTLNEVIPLEDGRKHWTNWCKAIDWRMFKIILICTCTMEFQMAYISKIRRKGKKRLSMSHFSTT